MNISAFAKYEETLIKETAISTIPFDDIFGCVTNDELQSLNDKIQNELAERIHSNFIFTLADIYAKSKGVINSNLFIGESIESVSKLPDFSINDIPYICDQLHVLFLNSKFEFKKQKFSRIKSKSNLIEKGAVYTDHTITDEIVRNAFVNSKSEITENTRILDFACGTGRFYTSVFNLLVSTYKLSDRQAVKMIHAIDIDAVALNITRLKAFSLLTTPTHDDVLTITKNIILKDALMAEEMFLSSSLSLTDGDLGNLFRSGYDIIVSNPPYLVLKPNKGKVGDAIAQNINKKVDYYRNCGKYVYSIEGMLNLYQLSIEAMLSMLKPNGSLGVICPSTLFADMSATRLRKHLIISNSLLEIKYFSENDQLFENITQATCIFYLTKGGKTSSIQIEDSGKKFDVPLSLIAELFPKQMEVPSISEIEWDILRKIANIGKLKDLNGVRNRRGELDLTLLKEFITTDPSTHRLVRGNMIGDSGIKDSNKEYVAADFIKVKTDDYIKNDYNRRRLVCQQISNMGCTRRLRFVFCEPTDVLGNSCNYISSDPTTLSKLYLILNSSILNWRFKITSSNNHINNYEIDELPIINLDAVDPDFSYTCQEELDNYIGSQYGLAPNEIAYISSK